MTAREETLTGRGRWLPMLGIAPWMLLGFGCEPSETPDSRPDAGIQTDGGSSHGDGTDAGMELDGGTETDGGVGAEVSCREAQHHPQLGTLRLQPGFTLA